MSPPRPEPPDPATVFQDLDRLLEHRVRLTICVLLSRDQQLSFRRLKELLAETDGSLGAHLARLEQARYLSLKKQFQDRKPITWYRLTRSGKKALRSHMEALRALLGPDAS